MSAISCTAGLSALGQTIREEIAKTTEREEGHTLFNLINAHTVKPVLSGHSKIDQTKILMTNGSLMKVESIEEAFCNTFDLHPAIIGLENQLRSFFEWPLKTGCTVLLYCTQSTF